MIDKKLLKDQMKMHLDTGADLAKALGITRATLSTKINEYRGAEFTNSEMAIIKERYRLKPTQMDRIFFVKEVSNLDTKAQP